MLGLNIKHLFSSHIFLQITFNHHYAANYTQTDNGKFNLKIAKQHSPTSWPTNIKLPYFNRSYQTTIAKNKIDANVKCTAFIPSAGCLCPAKLDGKLWVQQPANLQINHNNVAGKISDRSISRANLLRHAPIIVSYQTQILTILVWFYKVFKTNQNDWFFNYFLLKNK